MSATSKLLTASLARRSDRLPLEFAYATCVPANFMPSNVRSPL
ncbi:hypothetical protein [Streptomyces avermitilis]|nr:hypothetical protein [Streptomyces avermitilis]